MTNANVNDSLWSAWPMTSTWASPRWARESSAAWSSSLVSKNCEDNVSLKKSLIKNKLEIVHNCKTLKRKNKKGGKRKRKPETVGGSVSNNSISGLLQAQDQEVTKNSSKARGSSNKENVAAATAKGIYIRFALIYQNQITGDTQNIDLR